MWGGTMHSTGSRAGQVWRMAGSSAAAGAGAGAVVARGGSEAPGLYAFGLRAAKPAFPLGRGGRVWETACSIPFLRFRTRSPHMPSRAFRSATLVAALLLAMAPPAFSDPSSSVPGLAHRLKQIQLQLMKERARERGDALEELRAQIEADRAPVVKPARRIRQIAARSRRGASGRRASSPARSEERRVGKAARTEW